MISRETVSGNGVPTVTATVTAHYLVINPSLFTYMWAHVYALKARIQLTQSSAHDVITMIVHEIDTVSDNF